MELCLHFCPTWDGLHVLRLWEILHCQCGSPEVATFLRTWNVTSLQFPRRRSKRYAVLYLKRWFHCTGTYKCARNERPVKSSWERVLCRWLHDCWVERFDTDMWIYENLKLQSLIQSSILLPDLRVDSRFWKHRIQFVAPVAFIRYLTDWDWESDSQIFFRCHPYWLESLHDKTLHTSDIGLILTFQNRERYTVFRHNLVQKQPLEVHNHTAMGFVKARTPPLLLEALQRYFHTHKNDYNLEVRFPAAHMNSWEINVQSINK